MKSVIFYHRDMFGCERLVPGESKRILIPLALKMDLLLLGRSGPHVPHTLKDRSVAYAGIFSLFTRLWALKKKGCTAIVIESPFTADGIFCTLICTIIGIDIVFQPFAQFSSYLMQRRLFRVNPDVRMLEKRKILSGTAGRRDFLLHKKLSIILMRICFRIRGLGWLTLSKFEEDEIGRLFDENQSSRFIRVPWAMTDDTLTVGQTDFFSNFPESDGKLKFVVWSRLDYELKGIDRLLAGIAADQATENLEYHVFLIGPDYAGGLDKVLTRIAELNIGGRVTVIGPDRYRSGDHSPLATADASLLLSRWDGFPRALRESLQLNLPLLVSPETHFCDLVTEFGVGECVEQPDNPESMRSALARLVHGIGKCRYQRAAFENAKNSLSADQLAVKMESGLRFCLRKSN